MRGPLASRRGAARDARGRGGGAGARGRGAGDLRAEVQPRQPPVGPQPHRARPGFDPVDGVAGHPVRGGEAPDAIRPHVQAAGASADRRDPERAGIVRALGHVPHHRPAERGGRHLPEAAVGARPPWRRSRGGRELRQPPVRADPHPAPFPDVDHVGREGRKAVALSLAGQEPRPRAGAVPHGEPVGGADPQPPVRLGHRPHRERAVGNAAEAEEPTGAGDRLPPPLDWPEPAQPERLAAYPHPPTRGRGHLPHPVDVRLVPREKRAPPLPAGASGAFPGEAAEKAAVGAHKRGAG